MSAALEPASGRTQTVKLSAWVYGTQEGPPLDDAAEEYHEASKIYPSFAGRDTGGIRRLESTPQLQLSAVRAVKRHAHRPALVLPPPELPDVSFTTVLYARRSGRSFADADVALRDLATVLHSAYGVTHLARLPDGRRGQPLRAVPSGGALYPLEVYILVQRVDSASPGLYHYDPLRHVLERLPLRGEADVSRLTAYPELVRPAAAVVLVTAMFWRTRFKYALRGYRFALLEAGHLGQNLMLAAAALGLAVVPVGGVYDRRVEDLLDVDGVNESLVYAFSLGCDGGDS
jgi:SagB-type dehydrogenase family enzyme